MLRFAGVLAALGLVFGAADQARADVQGNTYAVYALSTVSGDFGALLSFSNNIPGPPLGINGNFGLLADDGDEGVGTYRQFLGTIVQATGTNGNYAGGFTAFSIGNFIIGNGSGNAGDAFVFIGTVTP